MTPRPDSQSRLHRHCMEIAAHRKRSTAIIDDASEPGSWGDALASPSCKISRETVAKPFASPLPAGDTGLNSSPVNLPAASAEQGGGRFCERTKS